MKLFKIALTMLITSHLYAGNEGLNGNGPAEKNILSAYMNLSYYIDHCLKDRIFCTHNHLYTELGNKLLSDLNDPKIKNQLHFIKEENFHFYFESSSEKRKAYTAPYIGSPIYFNIKKLYTNENGIKEPMSISKSASLLIELLSTHYSPEKAGFIRMFAKDIYKVASIKHQYINTPYGVEGPQLILLQTEDDFRKASLMLKTEFHLKPIKLGNKLYNTLKKSFPCFSQQGQLVFNNAFWSKTKTHEYEATITSYLKCSNMDQWKKMTITIKFELEPIHSELRSYKLLAPISIHLD